jgi:uncharacterized Ntn-hydrolase superfamily protein
MRRNSCNPSELTMTFSITARCERSGELGVAVTTAWFAVGALCPAVCPDVGAVASQAMVNPRLRSACLDQLAMGADPASALAEALNGDVAPEHRQLALVDAKGRAAVHTGDACPAAQGHRMGNGYVVAGNTLNSPEVLDAVESSWLATSASDLALAERMLVALDAGQAEGGDKRGRQSAAIVVGNADPMLQIDLRVDDHADPLDEIRRLLALYREKYEPIHRALLRTSAPTSTLPSKSGR